MASSKGTNPTALPGTLGYSKGVFSAHCDNDNKKLQFNFNGASAFIIEALLKL